MSRKPANAKEQKSFGSFLQKRTRFLPSSFWLPAFLLLALLTGFRLVFIVPPGHAPDELQHVLRAESLLHGGWIGHREMRGGSFAEGVVANDALAEAVENRLDAAKPWDSKAGFHDIGSIAGYMPLPYVPGAAAIAIVRLAGGSPLTAFFAVRAANFCCFLMVGCLALLIGRRGMVLGFTVLLLPMTLSLAASCSQDGLIVAASVLAVACLSRGGTRSAWYFAAGTALAVVAAAKPPYAPLAGLMLLPALGQRPETKRAAAGAILVLLPAVAWTLLEARLAAAPPIQTAAAAGPLWPGPLPAVFPGPDFAAQVRVMLAHPLAVAAMPLRDVFGSIRRLVFEGVGIIDSLSLVLPAFLYHTWFLGLAAAFVAEAGAPAPSPPPLLAAVLVAAVLLMSVDALGLALYLDWTPVGMPAIKGIQGRYFLPLLPFMALAVPRLLHPVFAWLCRAVPLCAACINAAVLPGYVGAFYAHH